MAHSDVFHTSGIMKDNHRNAKIRRVNYRPLQILSAAWSDVMGIMSGLEVQLLAIWFFDLCSNDVRLDWQPLLARQCGDRVFL